MSLLQIDTVKIDKEKAMQRYQRFKNIASIATTLQFCFAFMLFSWLISRSFSFTLLINHHFGFLLGNLIIITLFVKSGQFASRNRKSSTVSGDDDDDEFLIRQFLPPQEAIATEEAVSDEKNIVVAVTEAESATEMEELAVQRVESEPRKYRRTRSEEFEPEVREKIQLRRSETEPRREMNCSVAHSRRRRRMQQVEDLSNEEFQRKVEAFIERQQRFLREESLSMAMRN